MTADLAALERVLARTAWWTRLQRGFHAGSWGLVAGVLLWTTVPSAKLLPAIVVASVLLGMAWPLRRERIADQIDSAYRLEGRLRAALELLRLPRARRSPFEHAVLRDAAQHAARVSIRVAVPWQKPSWTLTLALTFALALLLLRVDPPTPVRAPPFAPPPVSRTQPLLERDELLTLRAEELSESPQGLPTELRANRAEYEALLAAVQSALHPAALIARALALESQLAPSELASEHDRAQLRALASELSRTSPALAQALRADLAEAARLLQQLSERLRGEQVSAQEKKLLATALEHARTRERERMAALERESELVNLLKHNQQQAGDSAEPSLLKRRREQQRELEALRREQTRPLQRELQKLSRELAQAGEALTPEHEERERAADAMQRAGEALDRYRDEQHAAQQQRALQEAVAQLRELLQQRALARRERSERDAGAEAADTESASRRQRFSERARGEQQTEPARSEPDHGAGGPDAAGTGPGARAAMVTVERRQLQQVETRERIGSSGGPGHDPTRAAPTARAAAQYDDATLRGVPGPGPVRSQVIRSAADTGFANLGYRKVYADYREHAEALLEQTQVPGGARFHVRRYFELVRPREGQDKHD